MTKIYLARHGKTVWNTELRMQGRLNSPLTDEGLQGALSLREAITNTIGTPEICYSSPMPRALQTAHIALGGPEVPARCPIIPSSLLCEMDLGIWEGMKLSEANETYPETLHNFRHQPDLYVPVDGGETFADTYNRAARMLRLIETRYKNNELTGPVLLVSHMILIQSILCVVEGRELSTLRDTPFIEQSTLMTIEI